MATRFPLRNLPIPPGRGAVPTPSRPAPPPGAAMPEGDLPPEPAPTDQAAMGDDVMAKLAILLLQIPVLRSRILEILSAQQAEETGSSLRDRTSATPFLAHLMGLDEEEEEDLPPPARSRP